MKKYMLLAAAVLVASSAGGCALFTKTPALSGELSYEQAGLDAAAQPTGSAQVAVGWNSGRGTIVPTMYTDKDGNQQPFTVDAPCGRKNIPAVEGQSDTSANASVSVTAGTSGQPAASPGVGGGLVEGAAFGESAIIDKLTQLQVANNAGPKTDVLTSYNSCGPQTKQ